MKNNINSITAKSAREVFRTFQTYVKNLTPGVSTKSEVFSYKGTLHKH